MSASNSVCFPNGEDCTFIYNHRPHADDFLSLTGGYQGDQSDFFGGDCAPLATSLVAAPLVTNTAPNE